VRHAADLLDLAPVRRVHLTAAAEHAEGLAALPQLASLVTLDLSSNHLNDMAAQALAGSPHLAGLTTLDLNYNGIREQGARALARSPHLGRLTVLRIGGNPVAASNEGRQALTARFGERVSFTGERDPDHLYALQTYDGYGWHAGVTADDQQVLMLNYRCL